MVTVDEYTWVACFTLDDGLNVERPRPSERDSLGQTLRCPLGTLRSTLSCTLRTSCLRIGHIMSLWTTFTPAQTCWRSSAARMSDATTSFKKHSGGFPKEIKNTKLKEQNQSNYMTRNGRIAAGVWVDKKKMFVATKFCGLFAVRDCEEKVQGRDPEHLFMPYGRTRVPRPLWIRGSRRAATGLLCNLQVLQTSLASHVLLAVGSCAPSGISSLQGPYGTLWACNLGLEVLFD